MQRIAIFFANMQLSPMGLMLAQPVLTKLSKGSAAYATFGPSWSSFTRHSLAAAPFGKTVLVLQI